MTAVLPARTEDRSARARSIAAEVDEAAQRPQPQRGLPDSTIAAFHEHDLFRAMAPREAGGGQCGVEQAFSIIEDISRADGAAGWALMAGMTTLAIAGAYLGDDAVEAIFSDPHAVTAGQVAPLGTAVRTSAGFEVSGRFGFSSGSQHSSWIFGGYREQGADGPVKLANGMPNVLGAVVPRARVDFLGNWDVLGLQHTWSEDYSVPAQEIPAGFAFSVFDATPLRGGPSYGIGVNGLTCVAHAAWACGVARRALDELVAHVQGRRSATRRTLVDDSHFQHDYAMAEAALGAARCQARDAIAGLESAALQGAVTVELRARARLATSYVCTTAAAAIHTAYGYSGSTGLRPGVLQQCFRDISAGEQHVFTDHNSVATAGRVMLGLASPELFF